MDILGSKCLVIQLIRYNPLSPPPMRAHPLSIVCLWAGLAGLAPLPVEAQDAADDPAPVQAGPTIDVADLWHRFRHKDEPAQTDTAAEADPQRRFLVVVPAIGARPSTGVTLGL